MENRDKKHKIVTGVVISDKMAKTRVVEARFHDRHARYGKLVVRRRRYKAHDEKNEAHVGDKVVIRETRPLSKDKRWILLEIVEKAVNKEVVA